MSFIGVIGCSLTVLLATDKVEPLEVGQGESERWRVGGGDRESVRDELDKVEEGNLERHGVKKGENGDLERHGVRERVTERNLERRVVTNRDKREGHGERAS